ncbi:DNA ligase D [Achromobacter xylosoxidans]|uniref:DNA ligase D n=1 Tax=Alcaligenes xylosoxydans xylosoxydans TaxID=85698 RepID=UPI0006BF0044|nr:DNA ligase D [Achromobacter xylosoxidans]QQE59599.1 DNA ligase D [Achromobacter xylosoxidans]QQV13343.1 DNA ligase D [Achromobacter xylosoxidans]UXL03389.1 DNA ligase D [Achromobacter xylosoxidans]CUJ28604.1 Putative DNA ligase-like protein Rv0938/MT0965 [Achromobacter xylosoxidans]
MADTLAKYRAKRNFNVTSEPAEGGQANEAARAFVIQKHWASRLHYDFRLELDGAMKSWAVPKGPSYDPSVKRMAVQVEDHPIAYNRFEGEIPKGQYGAGKVIIWDRGTWAPVGDPADGYRRGHLKFDLHGVKMRGRWALIRMKGRESEKQPPWLLVKDRDEHARAESEFSVVDEQPDSVATPPRTGARAVPAAAPGARPDAAASPSASPSSSAPPSSDAGAAGLPGEAAPLPELLKPQLATLVEGVPRQAGDDWIYEMKFDGYRLLARLRDGQVRLYTRNGHDWGPKLPHLVRALQRLPLPDAWIDGEIVMLADNGAPSFQALQNAFDGERTDGILFYAFDLPYVTGRDLRQEPLRVRRAVLARVMEAAGGDPLRFSEAFDAAPADLVASACKMGLEGIIAKRLSAPYVSRRSDSWVKLKCARRQEFVIAGYTDPKGARVGLGALLLAYHDEDGGLVYAGKVGTGFDDMGLAALQRRLSALETERPAVKAAGIGRGVHWVRPELVAEVSFGEWTASGHVRHPVFRGLRTDKPARAITREAAMGADTMQSDNAAGKAGKAKPGKAKPGNAQTGKAQAGKAQPGAGKLTHPERIIDPSTGLTKLDLARYDGLVAPLLLRHLKDRPVSFLRAPSGLKGEFFFQKHLEAPMPSVRPLPQELDPDHPPLMEVPTPQAIMSAAQMNVVEFHTWNAVKSAIDKPDRMLFDLDPGEGVAWPSMQQAARLVHVMLREIGLRSWLKTSGGKGLHVVVPLRRQYDWDTVKAFSQAIVQHLARTLPQVFVAKSGPKNRVGRIFADYLRNGFGATTVAAWSARARPGMGVSVPLAWDELDEVRASDQWTIANIHTRLDVGDAPWDDYTPQALGAAMKAMDFKPDSGG